MTLKKRVQRRYHRTRWWDDGATVKILHFMGPGWLTKRPLVDATGGSQRVALEVARVQARRGFDVTIASVQQSAWKGEWENVKLRHIRSRPWAKVTFRGVERDFRQQLSLAEFAHLGRFDILHLHEHHRTRLIGRIPKVMHFHNNPMDGVSETSFDKSASQYWRAIGRADAQIAVSQFVGNRLRMSHDRAGSDAPPANIFVNQSGVHSRAQSGEQQQQARDRIRSELGLKNSDVLFLFAGALRSEKGVVQLARAFADLVKTDDKVFLAIAGGREIWGDGDGNRDTADQQVHDLLADASAKKRAALLGVVSPQILPDYYSAADVFVLPSMVQETFGLVILEAFAAGVPVIGARWVG
jgi:glycosyltransferase involved in cell wall biosynthesis